MQIIAQVWRLGFRNNATKALSSISHGWKVFQPPERRVKFWNPSAPRSIVDSRTLAFIGPNAGASDGRVKAVADVRSLNRDFSEGQLR